GERLPPTRDLAQHLHVARLTVATAYDWLRAEGYVYGRVGAGTFVAPVFDMRATTEEQIQLPAAMEQSAEPAIRAVGEVSDPAPPRPPPTAWARRIATIPLVGSGNPDPARYDFRPGIGAAEAFPWARWRRLVGWQDPVDQHVVQHVSLHESAMRAGRWDAL